MRKAPSIAAVVVALFLIGSRAYGQNPPSPSPAQAKPVLAILPFQGEGVSESMVAQVTQALRAEFTALNGYELVPAEQVEVAMKERSGPCDAACAVEIGRALGADKIVRGSLRKDDRSYVVELQLVDITTGRVEGTPQAGDYQAQDLPLYLASVAAELSPQSKPAEVPAQAPISKKRYPTSDIGGRLRGYRALKAVGYTIAVPSLIWGGGLTLLSLIALLSGGIAADYWLGPLIYSIPGDLLGMLGLGLIHSANQGIAALEKETLRAGFSLGLKLDPTKRVYGVSVSYTF